MRGCSECSGQCTDGNGLAVSWPHASSQQPSTAWHTLLLDSPHRMHDSYSHGKAFIVLLFAFPDDGCAHASSLSAMSCYVCHETRLTVSMTARHDKVVMCEGDNKQFPVWCLGSSVYRRHSTLSSQHSPLQHSQHCIHQSGVLLIFTAALLAQQCPINMPRTLLMAVLKRYCLQSLAWAGTPLHPPTVTQLCHAAWPSRHAARVWLQTGAVSARASNESSRRFHNRC